MRIDDISPPARRLSLALVASLLAALAAAGCSRDKPAQPTAGSGSAVGSAGSTAPPAAGSGSAAAAAASALEIFVNDKSVATVTREQLAGWPRLDTLLPPEARRLGTWDTVSLDSGKPKPVELTHPSMSYPDMVPAVYVDAAGGIAFGMFDPVELAKKGNAALREDNVKAIRIKLAEGGGGGQHQDTGAGVTDPSQLVLTIITAAGTTKFTGDKLLALPRETTPGNADQKGWKLTAVLEAAGVKTFKRLILTDVSGTNLTLDRADISDTSVPFLKLNKQSALRFRVYKKTGEAWQPGADLRALASINVK